MNGSTRIDSIPHGDVDIGRPTPLYLSGVHAIYWLGITDETVFRCNTYLIHDGRETFLIDPGGRAFFPQVRERVAQILSPERVTGLIIHHQDPDLAASMTDWLEINPALTVYTTPRTQVLLRHYGRPDYRYCDVTDPPVHTFPSGGRLQFIESPFLHSPGAFVTYDVESGYLFSSDIWAALDRDWALTVDSFEDHVPKMDRFHMDYMASNIAARGFVKRIEHLPINAILPQHGSILGQPHVPAALDYLRNLQCGTDIIYAALEAP